MSEEPLSQQEIAKLLARIGYGNPAGDFWFIGIEEHLATGDSPRWMRDVASIDCLSRWHDMNKLIPTWATMCRIVLRVKGEPGWRATETVHAYQAQHLGRQGGETFLTELFPLPVHNTDEWLEVYKLHFRTRDDYVRSVWPERCAMLRQRFEQHRPGYVFCYGKGYWDTYKQIFPTVRFESALEGQIAIGRTGGSCVVLARFFNPRYGVTINTIDAMAREVQAHA